MRVDELELFGARVVRKRSEKDVNKSKPGQRAADVALPGGAQFRAEIESMESKETVAEPVLVGVFSANNRMGTEVELDEQPRSS